MLRTGFFTAFAVLLAAVSVAQQPAVEPYQVRIVTDAGERYRGVLYDVTNEAVFLDGDFGDDAAIPLRTVRKAVLLRKNKRTGAVAGAILGGLGIGWLANQSFERSPPRSSIARGVTLTFAIAGGAGFGLVAGSLLGGLRRRIVRPAAGDIGRQRLAQQLRPFSLRYQQDVLDQLPQPTRGR